MTIAEPWAGTTTPVAPAPSALRQTAPEVARVGDPVEHRQQRPLGRGELVGVGVAIRLHEGEHALVVAGLRAVGEVAVGLRLRPGLGEPRLGLERALGRPDLEHLAPAAQRLADGPAAVDEVRRHERRV